MSTTPPPTAPARLPGSTQRGRRNIVRRARLEHLTMELLRLTESLRLPVPVDGIWRNPPQALWEAPEPSTQTLVSDADNPYYPRYMTAREIARHISESTWERKIALLGEETLDDEELHAFAVALLIPTALFATTSQRQRTPAMIARLFQVPEKIAHERLHDLGHL